jgi:high-affinity iron transporter
LRSSVDDIKGNGPGSYDVRGNVWHLNCCNPAHKLDGNGWLIFAAIFGWTNSASIGLLLSLSLLLCVMLIGSPKKKKIPGTILGYVFYWIAVIVFIVHAKWKEGRVKIWGFGSAAAATRREALQTSGQS